MIVSPSLANNALGRALTLAEIARRLDSSVTVLAPKDGPIWSGAAGSNIPVLPFSSAADLARELDRGDDRTLVVCVVKPLAGSCSPVRRWLGRVSVQPIVWFDEDDLDEAVHGDWMRRRSLLRRANAFVRHPNTPWRIRRRVRWWVERADLVTFSSDALGLRLGVARGQGLRVPHARSAPRWTPPSRHDRLRLGFLGTPVSYKGIEVFADLLRWLPTAELHVFQDVADRFPLLDEQRRRLVGHPGAVPGAVGRALASVDIAVLPQDPQEDAARFQLPAKLMDALAHGRPVVATDTPVTREFAGPGVELVADWSDRGAVLEAFKRLETAAQREMAGASVSDRFAESFTPDALAALLAGRVIDIVAARSE